MSQKILMPALSPTMTEGTLAKWVVKVGDMVESGQVIAEIETDKATMEVEAVDEGVIAAILIEAGTEGVAVNTMIAMLAEEGEDVAEVAASANQGGAPAAIAPAAEPNTAPAAEPNTAPAQQAAPASSQPASAQKTGDRIFISPLAKRLAVENGLDLGLLKGTGPRGRIHKADIELAVKTGSAKPQAASANASAAGSMITIDGDAEFELVPLNGMRKTIAKRLVEAKQTVPHFYLSRDMALDELLQARKVLNAQAPETDGKPAYKLSVNDLVIKACAMALMKVPKANAAFTNDGIQLFKRADISIAVATDGGLITPVIRGANHRGMIDISSQMKQLASKARAGKLMPEEYQGGSFTISNLGMFGIEQFQAIINPPQACILAVGAGVQKPVVVNGEIKIRNMVTMTLSVDHRAVDGALGAQLLDALKTYIENPVTMLA